MGARGAAASLCGDGGGRGGICGGMDGAGVRVGRAGGCGCIALSEHVNMLCVFVCAHDFGTVLSGLCFALSPQCGSCPIPPLRLFPKRGGREKEKIIYNFSQHQKNKFSKKKKRKNANDTRPKGVQSFGVFILSSFFPFPFLHLFTCIKTNKQITNK